MTKIHDTYDLWPSVLEELGVLDQSKRGLRLSQTALAVDAAVSGQGVTLVSRFLVSNDIAAGNLVEIGPSSTVGTQDFYLLSLRKSASNAAIEAVVSWLASRADHAD